jgi:uncharacterized protein YbjT (DUF2867 family)
MTAQIQVSGLAGRINESVPQELGFPQSARAAEHEMTENTGDRMLVTGAGGLLGRSVVAELANAGVTVRGVGRHAAPRGFPGDWHQGHLQDLALVESVWQDVTTVVHCASAPFVPREDRRVLQNLLTAARTKPVHIVYVSIAGIQRAAAHSEYYRSKLDGEIAVKESGISHTIVRITQFHPMVDMFLRRLSIGWLLLRPPFRLQPIDVKFAARELARHAIAHSSGRVSDLHGSERLSERELIDSWLSARQTKKLVIPIPALGPLKAFAQIAEVHGVSGGLTWSEWVQRNRGLANPYLS